MNIARYLCILSLVIIFSSYTYVQASSDAVAGDISKKDDDNKGNGKGNGNNDNQNYLEVNVNSTLSFSCETPEDLENVQTINNAFRLKFKTKNSDCSIYAKVSNFTTPSGGNPSDIPLELQYISDNSSSAYSLIRTPVKLTNVDQRLFVQPRKSQTFQYYYDLRMAPVGYDFRAGQYSYTITFTMTQP